MKSQRIHQWHTEASGLMLGTRSCDERRVHTAYLTKLVGQRSKPKSVGDEFQGTAIS